MAETSNREKATLIVGGGKFEDWTSVWIQDTWGDAYSQFKFTCAERDDESTGKVSTVSSKEFEPGTECTILLAGQLAITGVILKRQVAYDGHDHGVVLQGTNITWESHTSSIEHKTSCFDGKSFIEIATEVLETTDATVDIEGELDHSPFKRMQCIPGEPIFDFLERLARTRKVKITCNEEGHIVLVGLGGNGNGGPQGELIEGKNILKMQCVTSVEQDQSEYMTRAQYNGDNEKKWRDVAEQEARKKGRYKRRRVKITPIDQGVESDKELEAHCENVAMWADLDHLQATIVVQGWQPGGPGENGGSGGELWKAGGEVKVKSPMAGLDDNLAIQSVTYTQDDKRGTLTTLVCVLPSALKGGRAGEFRRDSPTPTGPARVDKGPARTGGK